MSSITEGTRFASAQVPKANLLEFVGVMSPHGVMLHVSPAGGTHVLCGAGGRGTERGKARVDVPHVLVCFSCRSVYETAVGYALPQAFT